MITSSKNVKECKNGIDKYKLEPYTISDADGIEYPIVKIGASYWMRENLRATKFKDGTSLVYQRSATDDQSLKLFILTNIRQVLSIRKQLCMIIIRKMIVLMWKVRAMR